MQVVTNENFQQLVETGKVPEFKAPEAAKPAAAADAKVSPTVDTSTGEQPRGADGKFTKAEDADKSTSAAGAKPAESDDEGGDDLPEHVRKVIGKKHRLQKEAEEFARDQWRERQAADTRAEKLQRELEEERAKSRPAAVKAKEPDPKDFATVAEYTDALVKYRVAETLKAERDQAEQQRQADEKAERERTFGQRIAAAKEKYPDFDTALKSIAGTELDRVHNDVIEYMQESEFGADILYHLAKHPETLERFRKLSPRGFIAQLGKLETKWEKPAAEVTTLSQAAAAPATTTPAVSKAPAPIAPLASDKATVVHKDPSQMSFQELRAYERQREAEKRAARR
jgi:hypothetical protein